MLYNPTYINVLPTRISLGTLALVVWVVCWLGIEGCLVRSKFSPQRQGSQGATSFCLRFPKPIFQGALLMYFVFVGTELWLPHTTDLQSHAITDCELLVLEKMRSSYMISMLTLLFPIVLPTSSSLSSSILCLFAFRIEIARSSIRLCEETQDAISYSFFM